MAQPSACPIVRMGARACLRGGPRLQHYPSESAGRAYTCGGTFIGLGLAGCGVASCLTEVQADDDFSEPFGGSAARTAGVAALAASGAAWITYDLLRSANDRRFKNVAEEDVRTDVDVIVVTREQLDEGYTGVARYESKQGWIYTGDWQDGKRQGQGTLVKGNLTITATWHGNALHGEGVMEFGSGDRYEGQFENGQLGPVGQVCASYSSGSDYLVPSADRVVGVLARIIRLQPRCVIHASNDFLPPAAAAVAVGVRYTTCSTSRQMDGLIQDSGAMVKCLGLAGALTPRKAALMMAALPMAHVPATAPSAGLPAAKPLRLATTQQCPGAA